MLIEKPFYPPSDRKDMLGLITNKPTTVLDIGCREGLFIKVVKEHYDIVDSWGVEPDDAVIQDAKINIDNVVHGFFSKESDLPEKYFDLIAFNDVLEHIYDPWDTLLKAKTLLSESGRIIVSLPNIRHKSILKKLVLNDDFTYQENGILDVTHVRFFTLSTMIKMFEDTGYNVELVKPVVVHKKSTTYKVIHSPRLLFNFITNNKFASMQHIQYAFSLSVNSGSKI